MADNLRIEGGRELRRTLKRAGLDMKDLTAVNKAAANAVLPRAKATTPVGPPRNGHMKSTVRAGATQRAGIIRVGNKGKPYPGAIHWGWPSRGIKAQPWLTNAAKDTENTWIDLYWQKLNKVIDSVRGD